MHLLMHKLMLFRFALNYLRILKRVQTLYMYTYYKMMTKSILTHFLRKMASCSQPMIGVQMLKLRNSFIVE